MLSYLEICMCSICIINSFISIGFNGVSEELKDKKKKNVWFLDFK